MAEKRTILIDPVTRIEGHAKITLHLDEQGEVSDLRHLPGQPSDCFRQGLRRHFGRPHTPNRR
jgi:hypothetical protein